MKHLSAKQNLGHEIQKVDFKDLYRLSHGGQDAIWVNLWEYFEKHKFKRKDWLSWIKEKASTGENQVWGGKNMKLIDKSINKHGMQFPIALLYNKNENRIEYHDFGWRRIKYAILNDYNSIDAILKENIQELIELDTHFSKFTGRDKTRDLYFRDFNL